MFAVATRVGCVRLKYVGSKKKKYIPCLHK